MNLTGPRKKMRGRSIALGCTGGPGVAEEATEQQ